MQFYMPVKVYDETDCVRSHAKELASLGTKALIVTGKNSARLCGALDDVTEALSSQRKDFCIFSGIEENPSVETILQAARSGREEGADFLIGIGGGSPMDAAKAIAFLMAREEIRAEDLYDAALPADTLPVAEVPTTCGTGSEVTGVSVLTRHDRRTKASIPHKIFAKIALIDGKYLKAVPGSVLVNTSVDALAHMVESYASRRSDDYSRAAVLSGLKLWSTCRDILTGAVPADDEGRAKLMRASTFAGIAIAQTGTSIPHALSYILTYELKMPHGMACGRFLPGYLHEMDAEDRDTLLTAAGFRDLMDFIAFMRQLYPSADIPEETLQRAYRTVLGQTERLKGCRFKVDEEVLTRILTI